MAANGSEGGMLLGAVSVGLEAEFNALGILAGVPPDGEQESQRGTRRDAASAGLIVGGCTLGSGGRRGTGGTTQLRLRPGSSTVGSLLDAATGGGSAHNIPTPGELCLELSDTIAKMGNLFFLSCNGSVLFCQMCTACPPAIPCLLFLLGQLGSETIASLSCLYIPHTHVMLSGARTLSVSAPLPW